MTSAVRINGVQPIEGVSGGEPVPVSGTVTATVDTSLLAKDATLTGGTAKAIARGAAKGTTVAADATVTPQGSDHTGMDVQLRGSDGNGATVAAASTAVVATDKALAVGIHPSSNVVTAQNSGLRSATAPALADAAAVSPQLDRAGAVRINADIYDQLHQTHLIVGPAGYAGTALAIACDGLRTDLDGAVVYYQPRGRPWQIVDGNTFADASKWSGANWTIAGAKATHTAGATTALTATIDATRLLVVGKRYAFKLKVSGRGAGSVTIYAGTQAGGARSTNDTFVEVIVPATTGVVTVVPSNDFDGSIEILQVYGRTPKLASYCYEPFAAIEIVGIAASSAMSTLLAASDTVELHALYRRVLGAADLG